MVSEPEIHPAHPSSPANTPATANGASARAPLAPGADEPTLGTDDIDRIIHARHDYPHRVLGPHAAADGSSTVVRAFLPGADHAVLLRTDAEPEQYLMRSVHPDGLFEARVPGTLPFLDYAFLVVFGGQPPVRLADPYRFRATRFSAEDERLFIEGRHTRLFEVLGAWPQVRQGTVGVAFGAWAPNAARVSVVGTFNGWDGRRHPMQRVGLCGIWELFIPGVAAGDLYKFEIKTGEGAVFLKSDPFAARSEAGAARASIVAELDAHRWTDDVWLREGRLASVRDRGVRAAPCAVRPPTVPELPAGHNYLELSPSITGLGSGGLLVCGAAFETPAALMAWIDACHRRGVGVALAAGSGALSSAAGELAWFDGTRLYECPDPTALTPSFELAKGEIRSVLASSVLFWLERYHVDALATDAEGARLLRTLPDQDYARFPGFRLVIREAAAEPALSSREIARIANGRHDDPFAILGLHEVPDMAPAPVSAKPAPVTGAIVRTVQPAAAAVHVLPQNAPHLVYEMRVLDPAGLFEARLAAVPAGYRLRVFDADGVGREIIDPYTFRDFTFGAEDQRLFAEGNHYRVYEKLGAHPRCVGDVEGVTFAVWAPEAEGVAVVGSFNGWNGLTHQMTRHGVSGVWEIFVPGVGEGALYKFEIRARNGHVFLKSDPYALYAEVPPATASVVYRLQGIHQWRDAAWLEKRRSGNPWAQPIAIYEVHLGSWMRGAGGGQLSYRELATKLVPYVKTLGFTHIELMPIAEHPYEPSWGYQVSHFYAPTSRFGTPEDLMEFVDLCHEEGIGVILDWVAGHFPKDAHALAWFDGSHLYEHADPRKGEHPDWGTLIFNYGRHEVENFLIANALFWLDAYHFDGLRVDAVASMLYLDYSRPAYGGWIPNVHGGNENLDAIEFLKHINSILHARFPGILTIAEESTSWPNVSRPTDAGGLGFGFKWNMGWMHDTLAYMSLAPADRGRHHGRLTFSIMYAFDENFILALSHDEVVHLKRSLLGKMPGEEWEKFANLRLLFTFMYAHPGKKLLFMGSELGQEREWDHAQGLEWRALEKKPNRVLGWFFQDLNRLYRTQPALHEVDFKAAGFEWLEVDNGEESIIAFARKARDPRRALLFAANFSDVSRPGHRIGVPYPVAYTLLFDSNATRYGGCGASPGQHVLNAEDCPCHGRDFSIRATLPALSAVILEPAPLGMS
jgi:1,4-alpha-glucan branching enzyme